MRQRSSFPTVRVLSALVFAALGDAPASRADVVTYTDLNEFLAAAGEVRHIDFETLPDGNPSQPRTLITPEFNYTDFGVEFFSPEPVLQITGYPPGSDLRAGPLESAGPRNWIIVEPVVPFAAIGITFSDSMALSISGQTGNLLMSTVWGGSQGPLFLGMVSDDPIYSAVIDKQEPFNFAGIGDFYFTPIPEPTTIILFGGVAAIGLRRAWSVRGRSRRTRLSGE